MAKELIYAPSPHDFYLNMAKEVWWEAHTAIVSTKFLALISDGNESLLESLILEREDIINTAYTRIRTITEICNNNPYITRDDVDMECNEIRKKVKNFRDWITDICSRENQ